MARLGKSLPCLSREGEKGAAVWEEILLEASGMREADCPREDSIMHVKGACPNSSSSTSKLYRALSQRTYRSPARSNRHILGVDKRSSASGWRSPTGKVWQLGLLRRECCLDQCASRASVR